MASTQPPADEQQNKTPELSIVITIVSGSVHLKACLEALQRQEDCPGDQQEVVVPYDRDDATIRALQGEFPAVTFHPVKMTVNCPEGACHEHFDQLRAAGLEIARGRVVAILEDHEMPDPAWCRNMLETHREPYAAGFR